MKLIKIISNGEMNELTLNANSNNLKSKLQGLTDYKINKLYSWEYNDSIIICYGCYDNSSCSGTENKHELPPNANKFINKLDDSDKQLLFGDEFIVMKKGNKFVDLDISDYSIFYTLCFEGFDECLTDDDDDDDDDSDLNDFIVSDTSITSDDDLINDDLIDDDLIDDDLIDDDYLNSEGSESSEESEESGESDKYELKSSDSDEINSDCELDEDLNTY